MLVLRFKAPTGRRHRSSPARRAVGYATANSPPPEYCEPAYPQPGKVTGLYSRHLLVERFYHREVPNRACELVAQCSRPGDCCWPDVAHTTQSRGYQGGLVEVPSAYLAFTKAACWPPRRGATRTAMPWTSAVAAWACAGLAPGGVGRSAASSIREYPVRYR